MEKINWARVVYTGMLTGLVMNVFFLGGCLSALHLTLAWSRQQSWVMGGLMAFLIFLATILEIGFYAAIRPRYGAGPWTAAMTGVGLGFLFCLFQFITWILTARPIPPMVLATSAAIASVILVIAALLGAWIYEKPAS